MRTELRIIFADLVDDPQFDEALRTPIEVEDWSDPALWRMILSVAEEFVLRLRSENAEFAEATRPFPDSYWPVLAIWADGRKSMPIDDLRVFESTIGSVGFRIKWDYGIICATELDMINTVEERLRTVLVTWSHLRRAVVGIRCGIRLAGEATDSVESLDALETQHLSVMDALALADQRVSCTWEYEIAAADEAARVWGLNDLQNSALRTHEAALAHLEQRARKQQESNAALAHRSISTARRLLFFLALTGVIATTVAVIDFVAEPSTPVPRNLIRILIAVLATALVAVLFFQLRAVAERISAD